MFETMQAIKSIQTVDKIEQAISVTGEAPKISDSELTQLSVSDAETLIDDLRTVSAMRAEAVTFNSFVERICKKMLTVDSDPNSLIDGDVERVESTV